jgi:phosphatidylserine decarboxylase
VHTPAAGRLQEMIHIPGRLFGVAGFSVRGIDRLFARNERVVSLFEARQGPMAVVMVGAINVASIETVWAGEVTPPRGKHIRRWLYHDNEARDFARGEEMGRFNMGSTAIVLFGPGQIDWLPDFMPDQKVRMGEALGHRVTSDSKVVQLEAYLNSARQGKS